MRYLLLIPALLLFLSYVPFVHKMEVKQPMKMGCCKKMKGEKSEDKCMKQDAASCVCICGFQYVAPDQISVKLQFGVDKNTGELPGYIQNNWKNPHLTAPWQPPDVS